MCLPYIDTNNPQGMEFPQYMNPFYCKWGDYVSKIYKKVCGQTEIF
jgi:hypothetical protein